MPSTASLQITGLISGLPEGLQRVFIPLVNSTSAGGIVAVTTATTGGSSIASPVALNANTQFLLIEPPSTGTVPLRIGGSTSDTGVVLSSANPSLLSVVGGTTVYFFSTGATTFLVRTVQW